jgi:hypothetical protein
MLPPGVIAFARANSERERGPTLWPRLPRA